MDEWFGGMEMDKWKMEVPFYFATVDYIDFVVCFALASYEHFVCCVDYLLVKWPRHEL